MSLGTLVMPAPNAAVPPQPGRHPLQPVVRLGHAAFLHGVSCAAALLLALCQTRKDRHDLHHTALGIMPEPMRHPRDSDTLAGRVREPCGKFGLAQNGGMISP